MSRAKPRGSRHYVVVLTKAQRQALLAMLEPLALSPEDYAVKTRTHALAAYDRLVSAAPWAGVARGLREAVGVATAGEEEAEGQMDRISPAQGWLAKVP